MIEIRIVDYSYASIDASPNELDQIRILINYAVSNYDKSDLDFFIPVKAEHRFIALKMCQKHLWENNIVPFNLSEIDLRILKIVIEEHYCQEVESLPPSELENLYNQFQKYDFKRMFSEYLSD